MQQLHPKAKWLFFLNAVIRIPVWIFIFSAFLFAFTSGFLSTEFQGDDDAKGALISFLMIWLTGVAIFSLLIVIFEYFWAVWTYNNYKYQFTEDAVRIEKGVIWKKYISIPYERVQNVDIYRGILARLLGLSDLQIQTAGYAGYAGTEGRLPGLEPQLAEQLRDELVKKVKGTRQGL